MVYILITPVYVREPFVFDNSVITLLTIDILHEDREFCSIPEKLSSCKTFKEIYVEVIMSRYKL